jgi:three-Cys-motif partner protein
MSVINEVGYWTEMKLAILREYSAAYTTIMRNQRFIKEYAYIDGFAGTGEHISKETGEKIAGSPVIALGLPHKFTEYHFIDLDGKRITYLEALRKGRPNVHVWEGDCNDILLNKIFPRFTFKSYRRALCLFDPYNLNPSWAVVKNAGELRTVEIFLNFMIMDANLNVLFNDPTHADEAQKNRFSGFWGDRSWEKVAYQEEPPDLFGLKRLNKVTTDIIMSEYRDRLKRVAGFKYVPEPIPMKNSRGTPIYYLFFASQNQAGNRIASDILRKYRDYGAK